MLFRSPQAERVYGIVFVVVALSVLVQGTSMPWAARRLGVDMQMISQVLNSSFSQRQIATLYDRLNQYRVVMEIEPQYASDPVVLDQVQVVTASGSRVPLSAFTRYEYSLVEDRVRHRSQFAAENVGFALAEGVSIEEALVAIDRAMAGILLPNDIQVRLSGSAQNFQKTLQSQPLLILGVLVAFYLVRTRPGLALRAVGESPATADAAMAGPSQPVLSDRIDLVEQDEELLFATSSTGDDQP